MPSEGELIALFDSALCRIGQVARAGERDVDSDSDAAERFRWIAERADAENARAKTWRDGIAPNGAAQPQTCEKCGHPEGYVVDGLRRVAVHGCTQDDCFTRACGCKCVFTATKVDWLKQIEERCANATEGPWTWEPVGEFDGEASNAGGFTYQHICAGYKGVADTYHASGMQCPDGSVIEARNGNKADADFIAHAREDVPRLISALRDAWGARTSQTPHTDPLER